MLLLYDGTTLDEGGDPEWFTFKFGGTFPCGGVFGGYVDDGSKGGVGGVGGVLFAVVANPL